MWRDKLVQIRHEHGSPSYKKIATDLHMSERTIVRIFTGDGESCLIETIQPILKYFGVSWNEVFDDTGAVVGTSTYAELQKTVEELTAKNGILTAENGILKDKVSAQDSELVLLKMQLKYQEEIIAIHNYYTKRIQE